MLYSIRMRSAQGGAHEHGGHHISGAERLITTQDLTTITEKLIQRALTHEKAEQILSALLLKKLNPKIS